VASSHKSHHSAEAYQFVAVCISNVTKGGTSLLSPHAEYYGCIRVSPFWHSCACKSCFSVYLQQLFVWDYLYWLLNSAVKVF